MDLVLFVLRIVVGLFFAGHGAQKLFGAFGGHGLAGTAGFFDSIGMKPGRRNAIIAGAAELVGGVLLVLGLLTPLAAVLIIAVMTTAILTVHAKNGPWVTDSGWEYNAVLIAVAFTLVGASPGEWSLDDALGMRLELSGAGPALIALAIGVLGGLGALLAGRAATKADDADDRSGRFTHDTAPDGSASAAQDARPGIPADPR